jgi:tetratricopeptide (TPR) repeat protein
MPVWSDSRVTHEATIDRVLEVVAPGASIDRNVLITLLQEHPRAASLAPLLAASDPMTVRAVVVYLGLHGAMSDCPVLALYLQHEDELVAQLAEYGLWSIWMQAGSANGNRRLSAGVVCMKNERFVEAAEILSSLAEDEPTFAEARFQHGLALSSLCRPAEAAQAYRMVLRLNPYHFGAAVALGHACVEQGHLSAALHYYRQGLRIHPRLEDIPDAVQELEAIIAQRRCADA